MHYAIRWFNCKLKPPKKDVCVDSFNSHQANHSIKWILRFCLDPNDLNESLEKEP